ncbi:PREDICTED: putative B3 domain-containing protein Os03g0621600 isoform X2 [Nelumbo nucifera]|uniref:B3 domain-containing protein Os03g0621600 isoform X2 n=1 Tax=Nelumbo nucifera TaxID=4432 RepID=A0A1U7YZ31_NELNU|nr:PREDICTED: putative B3 domain-containing protein Os03g0621600 isoform X2 [Nelumbo nucifera]
MMTKYRCSTQLGNTTKCSRRKRPSFFKVLLPSHYSKLLIPPPFIKHFNRSVPRRSIIRSPTGKCWPVTVKKIEKRFYFQKGWQSFVKHHDLVVGDLLVFSYHGNSKFSVKIYDRSACEKQMPLPPVAQIQSTSVSHPTNGKQGKMMPKVTKETGGCVKPNRKPIIKNGRNGGFEAACSYKTEFPYFIGVWRNSRRYYMTIPSAVARQFCLASKVKMVLLWDPQGRPWPVKVCFRRDGRVVLSDGWGEFSKANRLLEGDACSFEFCHGIGNSICVNIFRAMGSTKRQASNNKTGTVVPVSSATSQKGSVIAVSKSLQW